MHRQDHRESELRELQQKIDHLTANLEKMYLDRLNGLLAEEDFGRIYQHLREERALLKQKRGTLKERAEEDCAEKLAEELVGQFLQTASTNRELLVSLIERVELTKDKQVIIRFRFCEPEKTEQTGC
jgi:hypothetical protein